VHLSGAVAIPLQMPPVSSAQTVVASTTQDRAYVRTAERYSWWLFFRGCITAAWSCTCPSRAIPFAVLECDYSGYTFRLRLFTQRAHGSEQTVIFRCHTGCYVSLLPCRAPVRAIGDPFAVVYSCLSSISIRGRRRHGDGARWPVPANPINLLYSARSACKSVSASMGVHHSHMNYHIASS
jgi:hypothetical protein